MCNSTSFGRKDSDLPYSELLHFYAVKVCWVGLGRETNSFVVKVLRSTDSQGSNDDEPTEGLPNLPPNLGDSPVSSSYSELRQVG